jgi:hypothetical protein
MVEKTKAVIIIWSLMTLLNCALPSDNRNREANSSASRKESSTPGTTAAPVVTPAPTAVPIAVSQSDDANDVADGNGRKPPTKLAGIDLMAVQLEKTNSEMIATFTANTAFAHSLPSGRSAIWQISICGADGNKCNLLGAKLIGSEWTAFVFDMTTNRNVYVQKPTVTGNTLVVSFPLSNLPNLRIPSNWWAAAEYDGKWEDRVPNKNEAKFPAS